MTDSVLVIRSRRYERGKVGQTLQHCAAGLLLVQGALPHLHEVGTTRFYMALGGIAAATFLIGSFIWERVQHGRHKVRRSSIAWVEMGSAFLLYVEALERTRERHHALFYFVSFIPPVIMFCFAIFDGRIATYRSFSSNEEQLAIRLTPYRRHRFAWSELTGFRLLPKHLELVTPDRSKRLRIRDIHNREEAERWLREQCSSHGVQELV